MSFRSNIFGQTGSVNTPPNTFIGGVSATINSKETLSTKLGISAASISNFSIIGNDIQAGISVVYELPTRSFYFDTDITYYKDKGAKLSIVSYDCFEGSTLKEFYTTSDCVLRTRVFADCIDLRSIYLANSTATPISSAFLNIKSCRVYPHTSLEAGAPYNSMLNSLIQGVANTTIPVITTATEGIKGSSFIKIDITITGNPIGFYEIYLNGVLSEKSEVPYAKNLTANTSYNVSFKAVDIYYNKSALTFVGNITTNAALSLWDGLSSYYQQSEVKGFARDYWGKNYAAVYTGIRPGGYYDYASNNLSINDSDDHSVFTNGTNDIPGSIRLLVNFDALGDMMLANKIGSSSNREWYIYYNNNKLIFRIYSNGGTGVYLNKEYIVSPALGVFHEIICTYNGSGLASGMNIYLNSTSVGTSSSVGTYVKNANGNNVTMLGQYSGGASILFFNGKQKDAGFWKGRELTPTDVTILNNGGNPIVL